MDTSVSGIGVLDKAFSIVDALEGGPRSLNELVAATSLPRATVHRLAVALEAHGMVRRNREGRFVLGSRLLPLAELARPALERLRDETGESTQLYVRQGDQRVCVASLESPHGLRTIVGVGQVLPLDVGSAGRVLRGEGGDWVQSIEERERGVASVSAPVRDAAGHVVAAVSVSGPIERMSRTPGRRFGSAVVDAAASLSTRERTSPDAAAAAGASPTRRSARRTVTAGAAGAAPTRPGR